MKKIFSFLTAVLVIVLLFSFAACKKESANETSTSADAVSEGVAKTGLWENAVYLKDTELGSGGKVVKVNVEAEKQSVTFTIHTDASTVGEALKEHKLIDGEESDLGLMVKTVNGITADYNKDRSYWGFFIDGEYAMTGVDSTEIKEGVVYKLVYTK